MPDLSEAITFDSDYVTPVNNTNLELRERIKDLEEENKSLEKECRILADKIDLYRLVIAQLLEATESHDV